MSGWLYLIRNRDLYKIGITKNLKIRMRQLKPDNIVAKLYSSDFVKLERELHIRYKKFRIPQTEYFRLEKNHLKEIKQRISQVDYPIIISLMIFIKSLLSILLIFFLVLTFISLYINNIDIVISKSLLLMKWISLGFSFFSLFFNSGYYLSLLNELKFRTSRLIFFIIYSICFWIAASYLQ